MCSVAHFKKHSKIKSRSLSNKESCCFFTFAKQCIVLSTTEGSHHLIFDMQTHEVFPSSADSYHC